MNIKSIKPFACCFTGHRIIKSIHREHLFGIVQKSIFNLHKSGYIYFLTGGALGFDTIAAQCVLESASIFPDIQLILILPCKDQFSKWNESEINTYNYILSKASQVIYSSDTYSKGCMLKRNRVLVDNSSYCISYQYKQSGGTAYTTRYAISNGVPVINLCDELYSFNT